MRLRAESNCRGQSPTPTARAIAGLLRLALGLVMAATGSYARPSHPALRVAAVLALSVGVSLCFVFWTAVYGVGGFATVCGRSDSATDPTPTGMVGLLIGYILIGAALISLAVVWHVLGRGRGVRMLVITYNVFALLWAVAGVLLTAVAGKVILTTLMSNASCS